MTDEQVDYSEKRRHPRFPIDALLIASDREYGAEYTAVCINVSAEGLLVEAADDLPQGRTLYLKIKEADGTYLGVGQVIRKTVQDGTYVIGLSVQFRLLND